MHATMLQTYSFYDVDGIYHKWNIGEILNSSEVIQALQNRGAPIHIWGQFDETERISTKPLLEASNNPSIDRHLCTAVSCAMLVLGYLLGYWFCN